MRDEFPMRIIRLRRHRNMTVNQFAKYLGVGNKQVYTWEYGDSLPSFDMLYRIHTLTGVSLDWLVAGCGTMFPTVAHT
ncbi:transcriptional repressor [Burkholderia phage BcepB1A]|uniref:transcriptional repressor n=1 Tax=Burkholderia phage BcepB1A TaxID=279530 RepID=UPI000053EA64|nr:transcriptional repressor [Burkholderia phage BcepB1A]AAT37757.2 gp42 [Burkholderia phage BcepB1A]